MSRFLVGTSGYSYEHWRDGVFYPEGLKQADELGFYAEAFDTVELNNSFYSLPRAETFESWRDRTPPGFRFAVKASRFITHTKRLKEPKEPVRRLMESASRLGPKLDVVLWQLRPDHKADAYRLARFCELLAEEPVRARHAFEFRHPSWLTGDVYELLRLHGFALVVAHSPKWRQDVVVTAPFSYFRFHGGERLGDSNYTEHELRAWAKRARGLLAEGIDVYAYFNNDAQGFAVRNAMRLRALVGNVVSTKT